MLSGVFRNVGFLGGYAQYIAFQDVTAPVAVYDNTLFIVHHVMRLGESFATLTGTSCLRYSSWLHERDLNAILGLFWSIFPASAGRTALKEHSLRH